jgi:hypothetical protein
MVMVASGLTIVLALASLTLLWLIGTSDVHHLASDLIGIYFLGWFLAALWSHVHPAELQKRFVLTSLTILVLIGLFELPAWFKFVDYRTVFSTPSLQPWSNPQYVRDQDLLWIHPPYHRMTVTYTNGNIGEELCLPSSAPRKVELAFDRNGFRNDSDLLAADIAVIGDSFIEAPTVTHSELMTTHLGTLQHGTVANLGISGYGPQQELIVLKRYALPLHPKAVIWVFYEGNDLWNVQTYEEDKAALSDGLYGSERKQRSFLRNTLAALIRLPHSCHPNRKLTERYGVIRASDGGVQKLYFTSEDLPLSQRDVDAIQKTGAILAEAYRLCREQGIRFLVVFAPAEHRIYDGLPSLLEVSDRVKPWRVNDVPQRLEAAVRKLAPAVEYLDLTSVFRLEASKGTEIFLENDTHWTPETHRIVAETLNRRLASQKISIQASVKP